MIYPDHNHVENRVTTALLLAAGTGSRLLPLTQNAPKCMTMVNEKPILERLVICLGEQGFKRLVIVTGHQDSCIREFLGSKIGNMTIQYIHSPLYKTTNNIYSLWLAREIINEPFTLFEGDLLFDTSLLDGMIFPDRIAVAGIEPWMNGTTVTISHSGRVKRFHLDTNPYLNEVKYKTVNIYSFSLSSWHAVIEKLDTYISVGKVNCYYETVFAEMVEEGTLLLQVVSFDDKPWYEVDTMEDLKEAVKLFPAEDFFETNISADIVLEAS